MIRNPLQLLLLVALPFATHAQIYSTLRQAQTRESLSLIPTNGNAIQASKAMTATDVRTGLSKYDPAKPFATIAAAVAAASSGETVMVGPGIWNERKFGKTGVNFYFPPGSKAVYTGATPGGLIDDSPTRGTNGGLVATIEGDTFVNEGTGPFGTSYDDLISVISVQHPASVVNLRARTLGSAQPFRGAATGCIINQINGDVTVTADEIIAGINSQPIYWYGHGGRLTVNFNRIRALDDGTLNQGAVITAVAEATGEMFLNGFEIISSYGPAFEHQADDATSRCWMRGISNIVGGNRAIYKDTTGSPLAKYYYTGCGKLSTTAKNSTVVDLAVGTFWMDFEKLSIPDGGLYGVSLVTGATTLNLELGELECVGSATNIVRLNSPTAVADIRIKKHQGTSTSGGILVTDGTLRLSDSRIDTSLNARTVPLSVNGGETVVLRNVHLQSGAASSITRANGSGTVTVICEGSCTANVGVGRNVKLIGILTRNRKFQ